jgi:hypothetical protein
LQRSFIRCLPLAPRNSVFQQRCGDSDRIEPLAYFGSFKIVGKNIIAASGANQHTSTGGFVGCRAVNAKIGLGDISDPHDGSVGNTSISRFGSVPFGRIFFRLSRRSVAPEFDRLKSLAALLRRYATAGNRSKEK